METIKNYLENMFQALPKTEEILRLKNELLLNMEEKYSELKSQGKTENEAIGIVISEFGNIDELLNEMDIDLTNKDELKNENLEVVTLEEAEKYISLKKKASVLVGIGASLCLLGCALIILLQQLADDKIIFQAFSKNTQQNLPVIFLFVFIVAATALFIYSATLFEKYKYIDSGDFYIDNMTKSLLNKEREKSLISRKIAMIIGVCLCVLSPTAVLIGDMFGIGGSNYGAFVLLLIIAIAVFLFIRFGSIDRAYKKLLMINKYYTTNTQGNRVIKATSRIIFPLATCVFLIWGFLFHGWSICWIVYPITGILFGAFARTYNLLNGNR
ncbi:permease prefix domain 1-containing protein [Clostridium sp.]|uniref:permease prefix domain 1-containing protein n=1 Tax=Clostridium sp. TaxID=1506 RepID=UPI00283D1823|nr:permease prefix domain 1-containing protein [Clostridium sp.]MDR3596662.1 permease prefix domain 1-containing protein [Clostridium sp.]